MHPEHGKDPSFLKNFAYLMGERYLMSHSRHHVHDVYMILYRILCPYCHYRFMGNGLFTIPDYDTWKPRRQIYDPAFKKR